MMATVKNMVTANNWTVYLLSCADGTLYCGCTNDVDRRLRTHNSGKGSRYTRSRLPVSIVASRHGLSHGDALRLEYQIKQLPRQAKISVLSHG